MFQIQTRNFAFLNFLKAILKKVTATTFNSITVDSDTSTNDMVGLFATGKANNAEIKNLNDKKLFNLLLIGSIPLIIVGYVFYSTGAINSFRSLNIIAWTTFFSYL